MKIEKHLIVTFESTRDLKSHNIEGVDLRTSPNRHIPRPWNPAQKLGGGGGISNQRHSSICQGHPRPLRIRTHLVHRASTGEVSGQLRRSKLLVSPSSGSLER